MEQVIFGGFFQEVHAINTEYESLVGGGSWTAPESLRYKLVSTDGIIKHLRVVLSGAPGVGTHYDFTLMVNGAPTALTLEIAGAATSGSNMVNEIDVAPSDTVSLQCVPDNNPSVWRAAWTCVFKGDTSAESLILGGSHYPLNSGATEYGQVMCSYTDYSNVENDFRQVVPTAGTIKDFYVKLSESPGVGAGDAYRFTVRLNGATVAQSLIVTITQPATTGNDLAHNLVVAAGDVLTMMIEPILTPSATPYACWGMTFLADVDGESIVLGGCKDDLDAALTEWNNLTSIEGWPWIANESLRYELGQVCTIKKLYILLSTPPGAGNTYTFTLRIAAANSNVVAVVTGAATTGNSAALEDTVANDDYVDLQVVPDGTPDTADAYWGFVSYREPGWSGKISGVVDPASIAGVDKANIASVKGVA